MNINIKTHKDDPTLLRFFIEAKYVSRHKREAKDLFDETTLNTPNDVTLLCDSLKVSMDEYIKNTDYIEMFKEAKSKYIQAQEDYLKVKHFIISDLEKFLTPTYIRKHYPEVLI